MSSQLTAYFKSSSTLKVKQTNISIMARSTSDHSKISKEANDESESFVRPIGIDRKKGQTFATAFARAQLQLRKHKVPVLVTSLLCIILLIGESYYSYEKSRSLLSTIHTSSVWLVTF